MLAVDTTTRRHVAAHEAEKDALSVSKLVDLIDDYRDRHGQPSEASISRAIGVSPQTVNSWRNRGVRQLPDKDTLRRLAEFLNVPYQTVLLAAATDAGYLEEQPPAPEPPIDRRSTKGA